MRVQRAALLRWRVDVPCMRLDAQTGRVLLCNQQEVSADVHCLVVGQVDIPVPGALLPHDIAVGRAVPLLDLQMIPDLGGDFGPGCDLLL